MPGNVHPKGRKFSTSENCVKVHILNQNYGHSYDVLVTAGVIMVVLLVPGVLLVVFFCKYFIIICRFGKRFDPKVGEGKISMTTSTDIVDISLSLSISISIYTTYDFCDFHINMICKVRKFFFLQIFNFDVMQINDYITYARCASSTCHATGS